MVPIGFIPLHRTCDLKELIKKRLLLLVDDAG